MKPETLVFFVSPPTAADNRGAVRSGASAVRPLRSAEDCHPQRCLPSPQSLQTAYPPWRRGLRRWDFVDSRELWEWPRGTGTRDRGFLLPPSHSSTPGLRPSGWPGRTSPAPPGGRREGQNQQGELKEGRGTRERGREPRDVGGPQREARGQFSEPPEGIRQEYTRVVLSRAFMVVC